MSTTVFKGAIKAGTISAAFLSDFSNADSDLIVMSYAEVGGGNPQVDRAITAPGGVAKVELTMSETGVLEILLATGPATDSGRLQVARDDVGVDDEAVEGSVRWIYAVEQ